MKDVVQKSPTGSKAAEDPACTTDVCVCIVTGLSGAGKSTALKVFEDMAAKNNYKRRIALVAQLDRATTS